jgi:hypothetical protein
LRKFEVWVTGINLSSQLLSALLQKGDHCEFCVLTFDIGKLAIGIFLLGLQPGASAMPQHIAREGGGRCVTQSPRVVSKQPTRAKNQPRTPVSGRTKAMTDAARIRLAVQSPTLCPRPLAGTYRKYYQIDTMTQEEGCRSAAEGNNLFALRYVIVVCTLRYYRV